LIKYHEGVFAKMRILGIDPGYAIMGWGVVDYIGNRFTPVAYGSLETEAHTPAEDRLLAFLQQQCEDSNYCRRGERNSASRMQTEQPCDFGIHSTSDQAVACRIWTCGQEAGSADG